MTTQTTTTKEALERSSNVNIDGWCNCITETPWFQCGGVCGDDVDLLPIGSSAFHWQGEHWHVGCALQAMYARVSAPIVAPEVDVEDNTFVFQHGADCAWERTTSAECEYKDTHNYCPHPEHACTCPQISNDISDNPTLEEAEAYLRANGVTLEDAANAFIEYLLQNNLRLKQEAAALRNQVGPRRCVKCSHVDTYRGLDGRCRAVVLGPDAMQGSGMAHCGCQCEFPTPPSTRIRDAAELITIDRLGPRSDAPEFWGKYVKRVISIIERCLSPESIEDRLVRISVEENTREDQ